MEISKLNEITQSSNLDFIVQKALDYSLIPLDILKFIEVTNFNIDNFMIEKFWHSMKDDIPIYISREILEWMGYSGEFRKQRDTFKKLLKRHNIPFTELTTEDKQCESFTDIKKDMLCLSKAVISQSKWLIMNSDDFKESVLILNTKNSGKIRKYYMSFEKLLKLNLLYTLKFRERADKMQISSLETMMEEMRLERKQSEERSIKQEQLLLSIGYNLKELQEQKEEDTQKIDVLIDQNEDLKQNIEETNDKLDSVVEKLGIAVEDRAPRLKRASIRERFVLFKKNNSTNEIYQYYAIRGQSVYVNGRLSKLQSEKYPDMIILIDIICQPNPRNLFLRFKERIDGKPEWENNFIYAGNNVGCSFKLEKEMINIFKSLDEEKRDV
uniref:MSV199 domain-containing protein n=1 Tax=Iridovirus sp. TaxID=135728 RepID=A0AAU7YB35_9VIRU